MERSFIPFTAANLVASGKDAIHYFQKCLNHRAFSRHECGTFIDDSKISYLWAGFKSQFGPVCPTGGMFLFGITPEEVTKVIKDDLFQVLMKQPQQEPFSYLPITVENIVAGGKEVIEYFLRAKFEVDRDSNNDTMVDDLYGRHLLPYEVKQRFGIVLWSGGMILPNIRAEVAERIVQHDLRVHLHADHIALHTKAKAEAEKHGLSLHPQDGTQLAMHGAWYGIEVRDGNTQIGQIVIPEDIARMAQMRNGVDTIYLGYLERLFDRAKKAKEEPVSCQRPEFHDVRYHRDGNHHSAFHRAGEWLYFPSGLAVSRAVYDDLVRSRTKRA